MGMATSGPPPLPLPDYRAAVEAQSRANGEVVRFLHGTKTIDWYGNYREMKRQVLGTPSAEIVKCSYCGSKRKSAVGNCDRCGAPE